MKTIIFLIIFASMVATVPATGQPYWFKTYSTAPYKEFWTSELVVKDLARDLPKVIAVFEKSGGKLTQPLATFISSKTDRSQQLSFEIADKNAKAVLRSLRKLGELSGPQVRPAGAPIPVDEVRAKINVLMKEKTAHAAELAKVPAAAAAQEEILEHLLLVEEVARRAEIGIRWNFVVRQK